VTGERLNGTVKGNAAADWMRTSKDGIASLDVRVVVETDERYTWLNAVQAVGKGELGAGTVSYEIAEVR